MKKVVINTCHGGFHLSPEATVWLARREGRECFPFVQRDGQYREATAEDLSNAMFWCAFDIPNPNEVIPSHADWMDFTDEQQEEHEHWWNQHHIDYSSLPRDDPRLVGVVEELGDRASDKFAKLKVVEIPDDAEWTIEEYDGWEWVAEKHRTWR